MTFRSGKCKSRHIQHTTLYDPPCASIYTPQFLELKFTPRARAPSTNPVKLSPYPLLSPSLCLSALPSSSGSQFWGENPVMADSVVEGISSLEVDKKDSGIEITCFTDVSDDTTLHFQIIRLDRQIYAWIGCNSAKLGHFYAAVPRRSNAVSISPIDGSASDAGSHIAYRLVLRTGLNIVLACNLPKNSPMVEAVAEKKLVEKLISLGYVKPKSEDET
ncbi:hypothetical protein Ancab_036514 [Ancistrocladus abbreviatus]